jgi:signal transduction histidine kinase
MVTGWRRWALAIAAPSIAAAVQVQLWRVLPPSPHLLFYPAIFLVASLAGRGQGVVATALSTFAIAYRFLAPFDRLGIALPRDMLDLAIFFGVSLSMVVAIDRTHKALARAERARRDLERADQAKDEILAIVSHDLRNPIAAISLSADSILRHPDPARINTDAERIRRLARSAGGLVEDIVDVARGEAGHLELDRGSCSPGDLLRHARDGAEPEAEARRVKLAVEIGMHDAILCDPARVRQILSNLIGNALKYTPEGGEVRLAVRRAGDVARFEVRDTGKGIRAEDRPHVFERHWTSDRRKGSGLGLHIARTLVEAHGGEIGVESELGRGTTIWFTLPRTVSAEDGAEAERSHVSADFRALPSGEPRR